MTTGLDVFVKGFQRYRLLSAEDKRKLLGAHRLKDIPHQNLKELEKALDINLDGSARSKPAAVSEGYELPSAVTASSRISAELRRLKTRTHGSSGAGGRYKPLGAGVSKYFMGIDPNTPLEPYEITSPLFEDATESATLVSDVQKAGAYEDVGTMLSAMRPVKPDTFSDNFLDIMSRAIEQHLMRIERPMLCNELSDFESSYAMQRATLRNLLVNRCTRNAFDETRVDRFLDRLSFSSQRLDAPMPPECLEPLVAFCGHQSYSFDPLTRLGQKLENLQRFVHAIVEGDEAYLQALGTPEECRVGPPSKYPFRNYYSFDSCIPDDVTGSINMGKPRVGPSVRYHNLQSVAHSLPADRKYRAVVAHAIRVLERSKGWDHASKVKAINRLVQVYNNLAPSTYYERVLSRAIPSVRTKGTVVSTKSRQEVFNRGLKYIGSLTRNHWMKRK
ncbi:DNA double-strand break repair rad50 ATPase, putative [Babesia ovis]|uniref:DNA double-strand break repair rad50 ATPase, putative n=1 Tax=Babesia ovis TaxID=5869 RepID=A0A9W5TDJ7_BABOV|nr:DNA double-strand break repair rad50 ATPase, putative [Babesia ovis]